MDESQSTREAIETWNLGRNIGLICEENVELVMEKLEAIIEQDSRNKKKGKGKRTERKGDLHLNPHDYFKLQYKRTG